MSEPRRTFYVVGISDERDVQLPAAVRERIARGHVFSGGRRHREIVGGWLPEGAVWIDITVPLDRVFEQYRDYRDIIVFASGDPLFFGYAVTLRRVFPDAAIETCPSFNSLQLLVHRLGMPYNEMIPVSLTGRPWDDFDAALIERRPLLGILTDREKTPAVIARRMIEYGYGDDYRMHIGERLGNETDERIRTLTLAEAVAATFTHPNNLILERIRRRPRPFGIPESEFHLLDGRVKMITKRPVRLLSLSMLDLHNRTSLWDVGFCTGSVSVEARLQFPHLRVTAFEIRPGCREILAANCRRFGTPGITPVMGDFMEADTTDLPAPDAVFIGGHGGRLADMLRKIDGVMRPGGVIVFNSVSEESRQLFTDGLAAIGRRITEYVRLTVDAHNAIDVMKAACGPRRI